MPRFPISLGCYPVSVIHSRGRKSPQGIDRAPGAPVQNMGVDHGGLDVFMTEELLNSADVIPVLQEMRRNDGGWAGGMLGEPPRGGYGPDDSFEE